MSLLNVAQRSESVKEMLFAVPRPSGQGVQENPQEGVPLRRFHLILEWISNEADRGGRLRF